MGFSVKYILGVTRMKENLKDLILGILAKAGETAKVKLAKLILFSEIEHFKAHGKSITGLYFVRLKMGPVIAFFDETLDEGESVYWQKKTQTLTIQNEEKVQYLYNTKEKPSLPKDVEETIINTVKKYGKKSGTELSVLSHVLPAWKYSEANEPILVPELMINEEKEYFALIDLVEGLEDTDADLEEKLSQAIPGIEKRI